MTCYRQYFPIYRLFCHKFPIIVPPDMSKKSIGFTGQRIIEVPVAVVKKCQELPLIRNLFITKMGLYPKAKHHYFQRPKGSLYTILIHCTDGEGWIKMPDTKIPLRAGEVYVIPSGVPHSYGSNTHNPWTIYWLHLTGGSCNETIQPHSYDG